MFKIRPITELMAMSIIGLMTTLYESSTQNMNENIREVWATQFRSSTVVGMESITKSVMTAIALARGLTVHIYLAAYALMFYPFLFERGITLLLLWMLICAVRSVVVNMVAFLTGCILCSCGADMKPVCFEFSATKAIEIACSVYMWLSVNDFHIRLRSRRRSLVASQMFAKTTQISDSDLSLLSSDMSVATYMDFDEDIEDPSDDSLRIKAAVDWLMKMTFGAKYENRMVEVDAARTQRFLNMSAEELMELQNRIKEKLYEDVGIGAVEPQSTSEQEPLTVELLDTEPSAESQIIDNVGPNQLEAESSIMVLTSSPSAFIKSQIMDDAGHEPEETEPSMMFLTGNHSTARKNKSRKKSIPNEDDNRSYQNLATQSTGSQTKEPSRKLQERLSKEEMSPKGSKIVEPTRKLSNERRSKTLSASRDVGMGSLARMSKSNSKDDRASEERLKVNSISRESGHVQGILRSPEDVNRNAIDTDVVVKKNVSIKKKQL